MPYVTGIERRALQRGIEQGIQQGIQKGVQQGARDAEIAILRDMLAEHLAPELPGPIEQRIEAASSEQLRSWVKRVPKAETLDDVFD